MLVQRPFRRHLDQARLFRPQSVALIGAETEDGRAVLANMLAGGFSGAILPVAPGLSALGGLLCYAEVAALPIVPDLAVVCCAPEGVAAALATLGARGCRLAIVISMAPRLREAAIAAGMRVLGPGSFGLAVPAIGLNASRSHRPVPFGRVALVSQSASLCRAIIDWAEPNGVGFSHIVGIGGNADLGFGVTMDWLVHDPDTGPILLEIRRLRDPRLFLSAARAAARSRPVLALPSGTRLGDPSGIADAAFVAALERAGVLAVERLEDLLAGVETLTRARVVRAEALAIVTNAVSPGQLAADTALREGLTLASPPQEFAASLPLPAQPRAARGLVYAEIKPPTRLAEAATLLAVLPEVGAVLAVFAPAGLGDEAAITALAAAASTAKAPLLVCVMGEATGRGGRARLAAAQVAVFSTPEQAVRGFRHLVQHRRNLAAAAVLPPSTVLEVIPDRSDVGRRFAAARDEGRLTLGAEEASAVLASYGIAPLPAESGAAIRVVDDAVFGPVIGLGLAGQGAEFPRWAAFALPPLDLSLAEALVARARLPNAPVSLSGLLVRISQLLVDFPDIASLAIEPLSGPAEITLLPMRARAGHSRLAIMPYPAELSETVELGGDLLTIHPIRPEDAAAHRAFVRRLPAEDMRMRFFAPLREFPPEMTARFTQVDYVREMAFIAERAPGEMVEVARLTGETDSDEAEFAIIVAPEVKRRGLGRFLMERLIAWARSQGIVTISGRILAENAPMLGLARRLGFTLHHPADEEGIVEARLKLDQGSAPL